MNEVFDDHVPADHPVFQLSPDGFQEQAEAILGSATQIDELNAWDTFEVLRQAILLQADDDRIYSFNAQQAASMAEEFDLLPGYGRFDNYDPLRQGGGDDDAPPDENTEMDYHYQWGGLAVFDEDVEEDQPDGSA